MTGAIGDATYMAMQSGMLINSKTASDLLQISERKLWSLMKSGEIPHVSIGRSIRYDPRALRSWVESKRVKSSETEREGEMNENDNGVVDKEEEVVKSLHLFKDFTWSKRARTSFHESNIHTLEQLTRVDPLRLLKCSNVGRQTLKEIQRKLSVHGLSMNFTQRQLSSMKIWTPEKRREQSETIKAAHAKTKEWKELRENLERAEAEREEHDLRQQDASLEDVGKNFVKAMDMAIAHGAIPAARELLDCCKPVMAKKIIDVVSAIESEM